MARWLVKRNGDIEHDQLYCVEKGRPRDLRKPFGMGLVYFGWLQFTRLDGGQLIQIELTAPK